MNTHFAKIVSIMSPYELERILKHLPEPADTTVYLSSGFDYSGISQQAEEFLKGVKFQILGGLNCTLNASKKEIVQIYRKSYESRDRKLTRRTKIPRRIGLEKVVWMSEFAKIELTPTRVTMKYRGKEPDCISKMRKELAEMNIRVETEVNMW